MIDIMKQGLGHRTPQQEAVPKEQEFSRIENLWPQDDSCPHTFLSHVHSLWAFLSGKSGVLFVRIKPKEGGRNLNPFGSPARDNAPPAERL